MAFAVAALSSPNSHSLLNPNFNPFSLPFLSPKPLKPFFNPRCSLNSSKPEPETETETKKKKKRNPRPSFNDQIRQKWSLKPISRTHKFPWQKQQESQPSLSEKEPSGVLENPRILPQLINMEEVSGRVLSKPLVYDSLSQESEITSTHLGFSKEIETNFGERCQIGAEFGGDLENDLGVVDNLISLGDLTNDLRALEEVGNGEDVKFCGDLLNNVGVVKEVEPGRAERTLGVVVETGSIGISPHPARAGRTLGVVVESGGIVKKEIEQVRKERLVFGNGKLDRTTKTRGDDDDDDEAISEGSTQERNANRLPWVSDTESEESGRRSKTELAEKLIPEYELKRLRNVALRMKERIKVGAAGVTQALVDKIKEKWEIDEVVKLRFEGPSGLNMKRTHEILEIKTGGVVIWRSGSSVVLYRGLSYKLGCVETYAREKGVDLNIGEKPILSSLRLPKNLSEEELMEASELNNVLDELGPRYLDWSGRPPLPVDADLLPPVVPGYKTPFRLLPFGVRRSLRDEETTRVRQLARNMPPHFALGRSKELQGLAAAMVKLWEKNAIAKIAIKRGVLNTNNDRMAEELKNLTGGTLLSRNKEYIVFYRGNDFLPPNVTKALKEREQLTMLQYGEEDARRYTSTLIHPNSKKCKVPTVAGTLAETVAATSRWGKQPNSKDVEKMMKESAISRRASLIRSVHNKYAIANGKLKKAERALAKVQECLEPVELPTDSETITDEERLVFRKMGLSMKPYLPLGRREVFDGTIENMHLHWKFRELVKIIVKETNFAQVKHIAISLEAESGGLLVSIDNTTKGYAIIVYRGKNYQRPLRLRPKNLLTKRQALARSIELQRREALKHHISNLLQQMELLKSELEDVKDGNEIDDKSFYEKLEDTSIRSHDDNFEEDEGEEAYLQVYDSGDEKGGV